MASPEYQRQHLAVRRKRGKAEQYRCEACGSPASEWAWVHGTDREVPENYSALCIPCHRAYDLGGLTREAHALLMRGKTKRNSKSGVSGVWWSDTHNKWRVQVSRQWGGGYDDFAVAVAARNALAIRVYGPGAKQYNLDGTLQ